MSVFNSRAAFIVVCPHATLRAPQRTLSAPLGCSSAGSARVCGSGVGFYVTGEDE